MKKRLRSAGICLILIWLFSGIMRPFLLQEDYGISVLSGIMKLTFSKSEIINYDNTEMMGCYVTESKRGKDIIDAMMYDLGFVFSEQMGSDYLYIHEGEQERKLIVSSRQFTRYYRIWKVPLTKE